VPCGINRLCRELRELRAPSLGHGTRAVLKRWLRQNQHLSPARAAAEAKRLLEMAVRKTRSGT